jgi:N-acetylated-alpha-linked acidic dipeptidase
VYDNYNWFIKNADPTFVYEQQQARVFGLEILHMADADILPYDYKLYGHDVQGYVNTAIDQAKAKGLKLNFEDARTAAARFAFLGERVYVLQSRGAAPVPTPQFNELLRATEEALLSEAGLPHRPWYKHTIYAPGEFTGYAAVVIPGVTEGIESGEEARTQEQLDALTKAVTRAGDILESTLRPPATPAKAP